MFKNAIVYSIHPDFSLPTEFEDLLKENSLPNIQPNDAVVKGFVSPFKNQTFLYSSNNCFLFQFAWQEKIIPPAAVKNILDEREKEKIQKVGQGYGAKEKRDIKNQIYYELLPNALSKITKNFCYLDLDAMIFVVDSASNSRAEDITSGIREMLGSFKVTAHRDSSYTSNIITSWLRNNNPPANFQLANDVILKALDDTKSTIRGSNLDLSAEQMNEHLDSGFYATSIGMDFGERISFNLGSDLSLKKIKPSNILLDEINDIEINDQNDELAARFCLMSLEIRNLWKTLHSELARTS